MANIHNTIDRIRAVAPFTLSDDEGTMLFENVTAYQVLCLVDESMSANYGYYILEPQAIQKSAVVVGVLCLSLNMRGGGHNANWCKLLFKSIRNFDLAEFKQGLSVDFFDADIVEEMQVIMHHDKIRALALVLEE